MISNPNTTIVNLHYIGIIKVDMIIRYDTLYKYIRTLYEHT